MELTIKDAVLLRKAVEPLFLIANEATISYSTEGISLIAQEPAGFLIAALRIQASDFKSFHCNEKGSATVDLVQLYSLLQLAVADDSLTIHGDQGDDQIGFVFKNTKTGALRYSEMKLSEFKADLVDIDERLLHFRHNVVVGIPTAQFSQFLSIQSHDDVLIASITISRGRVKFTSDQVTFVLLEERGECITAGVGEEDEIPLNMNLTHTLSFLYASYLSRTVWMLKSKDADAPPMLNCPFGTLGNIMFYFY